MSFQASRGKVPHFSMRPHPMLLGAFIMTLLMGFLVSMMFFSKEDGTETFTHRGIFSLIVTGILSFCLLILMTAKFWFPHLWKKNSTHDRHKQHSQYHPAMRDRNNQRRR